MTDDYGDGWVGGVSGYYNMWNLIDLTDNTVLSTGTLADNHESGTIKECLGNGEYIFNTTATSAFADEIGWSICNTYGRAGEQPSFLYGGVLVKGSFPGTNVLVDAISD